MLRKLAAHYVGKAAVWMHYHQWLDLWAQPSLHAPEIWARSQRKAKIPTSVRWTVWRRDNFTCQYCGAWGNNLSLDHVTPEKYGGKAEAFNLITACAKCNSKKGASSFDDFVKSKWLVKKRRLLSSTTGITAPDLQALRHVILERAGNET